MASTVAVARTVAVGGHLAVLHRKAVYSTISTISVIPKRRDDQHGLDGDVLHVPQAWPGRSGEASNGFAVQNWDTIQVGVR